MRTHWTVTVLFLATSSLAALAGCAESTPACAADADCGAGFRCTDAGTCLKVEPVGSGGAGGGGATDGCSASDDCLAAPFELVPSVYWDGSPTEPICTVPLRACPSGECPVPRECRAWLEDSTTPGLMRCELDSDCWSGRCLEREGVRFCLRSCVDNADCPYNDKTGAEPTGFVCEQLVDRAVPVSSCAPLSPEYPGRTLCRNDCDCGSPGVCAPEAGLACRFVGKNVPRIRAVPVCEQLPAGEERASGSRCRNEPLSCRGGACVYACSMANTTAENFCDESRCTQPCSRDADCPDRLVCTGGAESERVGTWVAIGADDPTDEGRDVTFCRLPRNGCEDEVDCCPVADGAGSCLGGWGPLHRRCSVTTSGPAASLQLLTLCADIDPTLAAPGACCAAHADCDSGLCVPARAGTACAGGGVCSVPCESDPAAGTGDDTTPARDRCAAADFGANLYHQESSCQPFDYELPIVDQAGNPATRLVPLNVCR